MGTFDTYFRVRFWFNADTIVLSEKVKKFSVTVEIQSANGEFWTKMNYYQTVVGWRNVFKIIFFDCTLFIEKFIEMYL